MAFRIFSVRLEPLTIIKAHFWDSALMLCSRAASSAARAPDLTPGAKAKTSLGQSCRTPCQLSVHPGSGFSVTLALSGYQPQTVSVRPEAEGATDARRLAPNPVHVDLQAVAPAKKPVAKKKKLVAAAARPVATVPMASAAPTPAPALAPAPSALTEMAPIRDQLSLAVAIVLVRGPFALPFSSLIGGLH